MLTFSGNLNEMLEITFFPYMDQEFYPPSLPYLLSYGASYFLWLLHLDLDRFSVSLLVSHAKYKGTYGETFCISAHRCTYLYLTSKPTPFMRVLMMIIILTYIVWWPGNSYLYSKYRESIEELSSVTHFLRRLHIKKPDGGGGDLHSISACRLTLMSFSFWWNRKFRILKLTS